MTAKFKKGDVVELNSGSHKMTVMEYFDQTNYTKNVTVCFFNSELKLITVEIPEQALTIAS